METTACNKKLKAPKRSGRPKSAEKRLQILDAAVTLFLQNGFSAASMANIAGEAGVSKQTLYSHFKNKEDLFSAVIQCKLDQYHIQDIDQELDGESMEQILMAVGTQLVSLLQDPGVVAMHRVVIGEVTSAPQVPQLFYQAGPHASLMIMKDLMLRQQDYAFTDNEAAQSALDFFNLLKGDFHFRSMLGLEYQLSPSEQASMVKRIVDKTLLLLAPYHK